MKPKFSVSVRLRFSVFSVWFSIFGARGYLLLLVAPSSIIFMEALLTLLFNALLLVFVVKLFALFHMKLVVILLYIAVLLFAMALTGRFPG